MRHRSTLPPTEELKRIYPIRSLEKMGEQFGCSGGTIRNRLLGAGFKLRPRGGIKGQPANNKLQLAPEEWEEIITKYKAGISGETIAEEHKVSPGVIYRGLVARGVELRESTAHVKDMWAERNAKLAEAERIIAQKKPKGEPGRPSKAELFKQAREHNLQGRSWPQCAEILLPKEVERDGRSVVGERLRKGVSGLRD